MKRLGLSWVVVVGVPVVNGKLASDQDSAGVNPADEALEQIFAFSLVNGSQYPVTYDGGHDE